MFRWPNDALSKCGDICALFVLDLEIFDGLDVALECFQEIDGDLRNTVAPRQ
jgi:hypothetical protein